MMTRRIVETLASSRAICLTALLTGSLCGVAFLGIGESSSHVITAQFQDADGLVAGNDVRIGGVSAGSVASVNVLTNNATGAQYAQVQMSIDAADWPLPQGTTLEVKPKGVLSDVFVAVTPGSPHNPPLGANPFFSLSQTTSPVNLDELTNVFTPSVRTAIRTQLQEGVLAFGGAGATELNQTLANANPLTLDLIPVTDVLATRSPQLDNLNFEFDTITAELARENANLRPLIVNAELTLNAIATKASDAQGTLVHAADVFRDLDQGFSSPTTQADLTRIFQVGAQSLTCANAAGTYLNPVISAVNPYIAYKSPLSLEQLLADLVTASGLNTPLAGGSGGPPPSGNALRVDPFVASIALPGYSTSDTGGLTLAHGGYTDATSGGRNVYVEQPPLTAYPTLGGCTPPAGLP